MGTDKFRVSSILRETLLTNAVIVEFIGDNIFPCVAPENLKGDFIIYYRDEYSIDKTKMGICAQTATVMIIAVSSRYTRSQELAEQIFETLEKAEILVNGVRIRVNLKDSTEDYIDKKYFQFLLFEIV